MDLISLIWNLVIWQIFTVAIIVLSGIGIFKPIQIQVKCSCACSNQYNEHNYYSDLGLKHEAEFFKYTNGMSPTK